MAEGGVGGDRTAVAAVARAPWWHSEHGWQRPPEIPVTSAQKVGPTLVLSGSFGCAAAGLHSACAVQLGKVAGSPASLLSWGGASPRSAPRQVVTSRPIRRHRASILLQLENATGNRGDLTVSRSRLTDSHLTAHRLKLRQAAILVSLIFSHHSCTMDLRPVSTAASR